MCSLNIWSCFEKFLWFKKYTKHKKCHTKVLYRRCTVVMLRWEPNYSGSMQHLEGKRQRGKDQKPPSFPSGHTCSSSDGDAPLVNQTGHNENWPVCTEQWRSNLIKKQAGRNWLKLNLDTWEGLILIKPGKLVHAASLEASPRVACLRRWVIRLSSTL